MQNDMSLMAFEQTLFHVLVCLVSNGVATLAVTPDDF
jgi:hypothetical protein